MNKDLSPIVLHNASIENTLFLDTQKLKIKIAEKVSENTQCLNSPEYEMQRIEREAYQNGLEQGRLQGYLTGYEEGMETGLRKGTAVTQDEFKDTISMLNIIAMAFLIRKEELFEQAKPDIIKLCLALCHKLLQRELSNPDSFKEHLEKLLDQIKFNSKDIPIDIFISEQDYELIKNKFNLLDLEMKSIPHVRLIADSTMDKGNCRLETSIGMLNFDIERMLRDLETRILEA